MPMGLSFLNYCYWMIGLPCTILIILKMKEKLDSQLFECFLFIFGCTNSWQQMPTNSILINSMEPSSSPLSTPETSRLRLHYFHIRGACQPVRNLLYYLEIDFEDVMHNRSSENEMDVGFNLGLPYLEDGEIRIHEAIAIMNYLCRKFQRPNLVGLTPQSIARTQEVLMKYAVQRKRIMGNIFQIFMQLPQKGQKQAHIDSNLKKMANECKFMQFCLRSLAKGRKYILDSLTLVDFIFYELCFYICGFMQEYINKNSIFKFYIEFKQRFESMPFFKANREKIENRSLFHAFGNPEINKSIEKLWKGCRCELIRKENNAEKIEKEKE